MKFFARCAENAVRRSAGTFVYKPDVAASADRRAAEVFAAEETAVEQAAETGSAAGNSSAEFFAPCFRKSEVHPFSRNTGAAAETRN